jgi:hypothetical protein
MQTLSPYHLIAAQIDLAITHDHLGCSGVAIKIYPPRLRFCRDDKKENYADECE